MPRHSARDIDVVVIGGGLAGLCMSHALRRSGRRHVVLEQDRALEQWRSRRWHSFRMNAPAAFSRLPEQVDGLAAARPGVPLGEMVAAWDGHLARAAFPLRERCRVRSVERMDDGAFRVVAEEDGGPRIWRARNVVAATGGCAVPVVPHCASRLSPRIGQLRLGSYRSPAEVAAGSVLIVGGGQTGVQLAEELALAGRRVFLATSRVGGTPRTYRGEDILFWLSRTGRLHAPIAPGDGLSHAMPIVGADHALSYDMLHRLGVVLLGRLDAIGDDGETAVFRDDLAANLAFSRRCHAETISALDDWCAAAPAAYPAHQAEAAWLPAPDLDRYVAPSRLNLREASIATVIWATGCRPDSSWLHVEALRDELDGRGRPRACETRLPGFFWLGFEGLRTNSSGIIPGFPADAAFIAGRLRPA